MIFLGFSVCALVAVLLSWHARLPRLNGISAFVVMWVPVLGLLTLTQRLSDLTWTMIWVSFIAVSAGTLLGWFTGPARPSPTVASRFNFNLSLGQFRRFHWIFVAALVAYGILQVYNMLPLVQQLGGWGVVLSSAGGDFKNAQMSSRAEITAGQFDTQSALLGAVGYVLFLGNLSLFTGAILWRAGGSKFVATIPLLIAAGYSLLSLQRTSFVMSLLIFAFSILLLRGTRTTLVLHAPDLPRANKRARNPLAILVLSFVGATAVLVPLQLRNAGTRNATGFDSLVQYLVAGVAGLDARNRVDALTSPVIGDGGTTIGASPGFGSYTFTGLFAILSRLGFEVPRAPHALDYYIVQFNGDSYATNIATSIGDFFMDFGWPGIVFGFFTLGVVSAVLSRAFVSGSISFLPFTSLVLVTIAWSFFVNALPGDIRYFILGIAGTFLLHRLTKQAGAPASVSTPNQGRLAHAPMVQTK